MRSNSSLAKYDRHRATARRRGISFELTFPEWFAIWRDSGHWAERGSQRGQYVMARNGDQGAYAIGNVRIILQPDNVREAVGFGAVSFETIAAIKADYVPRSEHANTHVLARKYNLAQSLIWKIVNDKYKPAQSGQRVWTEWQGDARPEIFREG